MNILDTKRPGVYSEYSVSSLYTRPKTNKNLAFVAKSTVGTACKTETISSYNEALTLFGTGNPLLLGMCKILLQSGINKLYFLPILGDTNTVANYKNAFAVLETIDDIGAIICDSQNKEVIAALAVSVQKSSSALKERFAVCGVDTAVLAQEIAVSVCDERLIISCPKVKIADMKLSHAVLGACGLAGIILSANDPASGFNGEALPVVTGLEIPLSEAEIEKLLTSGVTPLEVSGGQVECIKAITTRTKTDGVADLSFSSINTVLIIDDVITTIRSSLKARLKGLKNNLQTRESIVSQVTIELARKIDTGIIDDFSPPNVYPHPNDASICVVELSFTVTHVINQIFITANIKI